MKISTNNQYMKSKIGIIIDDIDNTKIVGVYYQYFQANNLKIYTKQIPGKV